VRLALLMVLGAAVAAHPRENPKPAENNELRQMQLKSIRAGSQYRNYNHSGHEGRLALGHDERMVFQQKPPGTQGETGL